MGGRWESWDHFWFQLHTVPCLLGLMLFIQIIKCSSLNLEGLSLLEFRASVDSDPYGAFANWYPNDNDPCMWLGVHCVDGKVQMLNLKGLDLGGILSPQLGKLIHLRSLILYKNQFSGLIPREIGGLIMLELLDLRDNNLSGTIPAEISQLSSLKRLLLCDNKFQGSIPFELGKHNMLLEIRFDDKLTFAVTPGIRCLKKYGHCIWQRSPNQLKKAGSFSFLIKAKLLRYLDILPMFNFKDSFPGNGVKCSDELPSSAEPYMGQNVQQVINFVRRRLLQESSNLAAAPARGGPLPEQTTPEQKTPVTSTRSSGSFPAIPNSRMKQYSSHVPSPHPGSLEKPTDQQPFAVGSFGHRWKYVIMVPVLAFLLIVVATMILMSRSSGVKSIGPWKTGISGQLQKAFIAGVPKLNRPELETACEDFSNIIETLPHYTVYKGTLSSGVEIAVVSSVVTSSKDWSPGYEVLYRRKIDTLSRVNHKNFVNLLGYCEEDEPFMRMMVFEYAPNGSLSEHLHVKEVEFLDWNARMRVVMGICYCLQYMHHELNPPVAHPSIRSNVIYLTDDYAAKLAEIQFWADFASKDGVACKDELQPLGDLETNVYSFGILLLEIICGKVPYSEDGSLEDWVVEFLREKQSINNMIDPMLKSIKNNELDIIKEVIEDCVVEDPRQRPTMREVTAKLRDEIAISPDAATPRLSPLWWAELEILSVEAT